MSQSGRDTIAGPIPPVFPFGTTRTLDQHIAQLRKKVECQPDTHDAIITVHDTDYRYNSRQGSNSLGLIYASPIN